MGLGPVLGGRLPQCRRPHQRPAGDGRGQARVPSGLPYPPLPASGGGYDEWQRTAAGTKVPHYLRPRDRGVLAFAGLYELWRDPTRPPDDPASWRWTTTILTTTAIPELAHLHDRMPVIVDPDRYAAWLDPARTDPTAVRGLLTPTRPDLLAAYPVGAAIGNVANDGPGLTDLRWTPGTER